MTESSFLLLLQRYLRLSYAPARRGSHFTGTWHAFDFFVHNRREKILKSNFYRKPRTERPSCLIPGFAHPKLALGRRFPYLPDRSRSSRGGWA
jgi:hypothetical protein